MGHAASILMKGIIPCMFAGARFGFPIRQSEEFSHETFCV
jgi:hypothetical protein